MNYSSLHRILQVVAIVLLGLPGSASAAEAPSTDIAFSRGVRAHHVAWDADRKAVLTFEPDALTLVIDGALRVFHRGPKKTLTIPYTDILSVRFDVRYEQEERGKWLNRALLIRYRRGLDGDAVHLLLERQVVHRVVATLEARSGVRVIEP